MRLIKILAVAIVCLLLATAPTIASSEANQKGNIHCTNCAKHTNCKNNTNCKNCANCPKGEDCKNCPDCKKGAESKKKAPCNPKRCAHHK